MSRYQDVPHLISPKLSNDRFLYEFACRKISTFQNPQQHACRKGYSYTSTHYSTIVLPSPTPLNSSKIAPITPQCSTRTPRRNGRPINLPILPPRNHGIRSILLHPRTLQSQAWVFLSLHLAPLNVQFGEWRRGPARHGAVVPGRCGCGCFLVAAVPVDEEGEGGDEPEADDADADPQPGFGAAGYAAVPAAGGVSWGGDGVLGRGWSWGGWPRSCCGGLWGPGSVEAV